MSDSPLTLSTCSPIQAGISPLKRLANILLKCDELSEHMHVDVLSHLNTIAKTVHQDMCETAGEFLHKINDEKNTITQVKTVVRIFPEALGHIGEKGRLPIQRAIRKDKAVSFIPLLALAGSYVNVGGEGKRGGLLLPVPGTPSTYVNMLQILVNTASPSMHPDESDDAHLRVLKELRSLKLIQKKDIQDYCLLFHSCYPNARRRFNYLVHWYPKALDSSISPNGSSLIHTAILHSLNSFRMVLKAGMRYYPGNMGFLFKKDINGTTACFSAFLLFGFQNSLECIKECIPPSSEHPILHYVAKHVPRFLEDFIPHYPHDVHIRDDRGRSLFHTRLAESYNYSDSSTKGSTFVHEATDEDIEEKDPVTGLYPFLLVSSSVNADLTSIYEVLRRNPDLIERSKSNGGTLTQKRRLNGDTRNQKELKKTKIGTTLSCTCGLR